RDFSASDPSVPEALRGTFKAFTQTDSNGMRHLAALARAGLTHVHLLPSFDIASVNEDKSLWQSPAGDLTTFPPSSDQQQAVLARIVPGYYHRLNPDGNVETGSCCPDTASEHNMMEKLLIDSVLTWARAYKVDGFRFDIMGFHMKRNMVKLRQALDALTPA